MFNLVKLLFKNYFKVLSTYGQNTLQSPSPNAAHTSSAFNNRANAIDIYSNMATAQIPTAHEAAIGAYVGTAASPQPTAAFPGGITFPQVSFIQPLCSV